MRDWKRLKPPLRPTTLSRDQADIGRACLERANQRRNEGGVVLAVAIDA